MIANAKNILYTVFLLIPIIMYIKQVSSLYILCPHLLHQKLCQLLLLLVVETGLLLLLLLLLHLLHLKMSLLLLL